MHSRDDLEDGVKARVMVSWQFLVEALPGKAGVLAALVITCGQAMKPRAVSRLEPCSLEQAGRDLSGKLSARGAELSSVIERTPG